MSVIEGFGATDGIAARTNEDPSWIASGVKKLMLVYSRQKKARVQNSDYCFLSLVSPKGFQWWGLRGRKFQNLNALEH